MTRFLRLCFVLPLLSILVLLPSSSWADSLPGAAKPASEKAKSSLREGRNKEALEALREVVRLAPAYVPAHRLRIDLEVEEGQTLAIAREYRARVEKESQSALAHYLYGSAAGRADVAEAEYKVATELDPSFPWAWFGLGTLSAARGDWDAAISAYDKALAQDKTLPEAWGKLAEARLAKGEDALAVAAFQEQIRLAPDDHHGSLNLGGYYLLKGDLARARPLLKAAVDKAPQDSTAQVNQGVLLLRSGEGGPAALALEKAVSLDPHNALVRDYGSFARAVVAGKAPLSSFEAFEKMVRAVGGEAGAAVATAQDVVKKAPSLWLGHLRLGLAQASSGQEKEGEEAVRRALALAPGEADVHYGLGMILLARGSGREADDAFQQALKLRPGDVESLRGRSLVAQGAGRPAQAAEFLAQAVKSSPWDASLRFALAGAWEGAREESRAEAVMKEVVSIHPGFLPGRLQLATLLVAHGDFEGARRELREAVLLSGNAPEVARRLVSLDEEKKAWEVRTAGKIRVSLISVPDRARAEAVLKKLKEGMSFAEVARRESTGPGAQQGGDLGYLAPGDLLPSLAEALKRLAPGQYSSVIQTPSAFQVVMRTR